MARHTASYGLYCQQFGRALRLMLPGDVLEAGRPYGHEQRLAAIAASGKPRDDYRPRRQRSAARTA